MNPLTTKLIAAGGLSLLMLVSGVILSHSGHPLSIGLTTLHKLLAIAAVVLIGMVVFPMFKTMDKKQTLTLGLIILTGILFLALIATGAFLTREEMQLPQIVLRLHQVLPLLSVISSAFTIFLIISNQV